MIVPAKSKCLRNIVPAKGIKRFRCAEKTYIHVHNLGQVLRPLPGSNTSKYQSKSAVNGYCGDNAVLGKIVAFYNCARST